MKNLLLFFVCLFVCLFFSIRVFFHEHSRVTDQQRKEEAISLTPLYHFHPLHRHLDIKLAKLAVGLKPGNFVFQVANH